MTRLRSWGVCLDQGAVVWQGGWSSSLHLSAGSLEADLKALE